MDTRQFEGRKREHIQHALNPAHQAQGRSGLDLIHLHHEALPELNFEEIRLDAVCLNKPSATPFYVAGMTAGHADAMDLNQRLALACQARGWAMGVGSQRRDLEAREDGVLQEWRRLRARVPQLTLFANLGISQLISTPVSEIRRLVDAIEAQALVVHLNVLQEALQPEGTPQFKGGLAALRKICVELGVPVVVKETGCGFSFGTLKRLSEIGLAAVDVSGLGGTHWGRIEGARAASMSLQAQAAETFAVWGESTVDSVIAAHQALLGTTEIWASGGVRTGLDAAKLIALGAHRVGYAQPALQAAIEGDEALDRWMLQQEFDLKVALLCTGAASPEILRKKEDKWTKRTSNI